MLDAETKVRIDSARDVLVGKVPDPKSQVEQITIALIYKFMDDMDRQSEELGGVATFFSGEFKKYAWTRLLDKSLGGHERLQVYAEGIAVMDRNPNIPQLFRDIFKGAFLPYRDPETLNLFLKEINGFSYDHSERLGDAFEYLLSVLGSQGEAGQFRTPRHIIDFIVRIVDPQKHETIADPACGTAGFLISAYKHILAQNSGERPGDRLSGDERARLMDNFCGYDISPDMVRLSRANLYLHGFANPRIHEYDTLTSEDRWDERYDVIMANPPFMSPKGGIRPHNRFSIKATRSEVLFVDYIAEHLHVNGRAGVIVPEGIIFQSQNAYKALRKMLVEGYLWCVVSLPPGVFNPYSGVKTSILLLDKGLAKRTDEILFVKVQADGFDLGAQRRPVERNDLPEAERVITAWKTGNRFAAGDLAHPVGRQRILASPDHSLSGDRYRDNGLRVSDKWPRVRLSEVAQINRETDDPATKFGENQFTYLDISSVENGTGVVSYGNRLRGVEAPTRARRVVKPDDVLLSTVRPNLKAFAYLQDPPSDCLASTGFAVLTPNPDVALGRFLWHVLFHESMLQQMTSRMGKGAYPSINRSDVEELEIPLPPLDVQRQIVAELDGYRKIIEGARQVIANYKPTIRIDPAWPRVKIGDLCSKIQYGLSSSLNTQGTGYKTFRMNEIVEGVLVDNGQMKYADISVAELAKYRLKKGDILFNRTNSIEHVGRTGIFLLEGEYAFASYLVRLSVDESKVDAAFLNALMNTPEFQQGIKGYASRAIGQANISASTLASYVVRIPELSEQRQIAARIASERALVDANRKLVELFEQKIQDKLAEIWGEAGQTA